LTYDTAQNFDINNKIWYHTQQQKVTRNLAISKQIMKDHAVIKHYKTVQETSFKKVHNIPNDIENHSR